ncbi:MAG: 3-methyl-2-oxobutanoate hydroxymethyltransferase [Micropepsaceae bacterium]
MSVVTTKSKRLSVPRLRARKGREPIVCLTAYTAPVARLVDPHVDLILVGDSLGQVVHGMDSTVPVPLDLMIYHGQAVMRASAQALVVVDLPFGSYEESPEQAFRAAVRVLKEAGVTAVKLEGGAAMAPTIRFLAERGIPVMAHIGLMPQQQNLKGYKIAGRAPDEWPSAMVDALAVEAAGAFAVVLEGMVPGLAEQITAKLAIPTIGIGASAACDGQILVVDDMLGLIPNPPSFVKRYADLGGNAETAISAYAADVRARRFPASEHLYAVRPVTAA